MTREEKQHIIDRISTEQLNLGLPPCFEFSEEKLCESYGSIINSIRSIGASSLFDNGGRKAEKWVLYEIFKRYIESKEVEDE